VQVLVGRLLRQGLHRLVQPPPGAAHEAGEEVGGDLALADWDDPAGEVVQVRAAGVNFADVLVRRGRYPQMPELPHVLGNEVAGELESPAPARPQKSGILIKDVIAEMRRRTVRK